jgi:hypothetical protein
VRFLTRILGLSLLFVGAYASSQNECTSQGLNPISTFNVVDSSGVYHQGACWNATTGKITFPLSAAGGVTSVFGRTGVVTAVATDYASVSNVRVGDAVGDEFNVLTSSGQTFLGDEVGDELRLGVSATAGGIILEDTNGAGIQTIPSTNTFQVIAENSGGIELVDNAAGTWASEATGGAKGSGTANFTAYYQNGTLVTSPVTSVFGRTGAIVAASGDYTVAQVTGAAPSASPTFTGTITLPNVTTLAPTTGTTLTLQTGGSNNLTIVPANNLSLQDGGGDALVLNATGGSSSLNAQSGGNVNIGTANTVTTTIGRNATGAGGTLTLAPSLLQVESTTATAVIAKMASPTVSSGFGTSPSITGASTIAFQVNVGTGGAATSGVIALGATASNGWTVDCTDITTTSATVFMTKQTASSTTTATVGNFTTAGVAGAWAASDKLNCMAMAF